MSDTRTHASELAVSLNEQKQGLSGNTEESKNLLISTNELLDSYNSWTASIHESTNALAENKAAQADEATLTQNINNSYDSIQKSHAALQEFKEAMSDGMTDSALNGVASLSDELKALVAGYHAGVVSADELYQALANHYDTGLKNYGTSLTNHRAYSGRRWCYSKIN